MMKYVWIVCFLICVSYPGTAQSVRSLVNGGNELYENEKFSEAEVNYRKALEEERGNISGSFNLGNSLYRQDKFGESGKQFESAVVKAESEAIRANAFYNRGNSFMKEQKYQEAIKSFSESLKLNPADMDAKYNLSYAIQKLKDQNQQQKQDKNDKNQNNDDQKKNEQDQNQDQNEQQDKQEQQNQQEQENQQQENQQQEQNQDQQKRPQQQEQMSKADAERILDVLKNNEAEVQKKLRVRKGARVKVDKDW